MAGRAGLTPGTVRRVAGFARPYRAQIAAFLGLTILDALLMVTTPLLFKWIIDDGVRKHDGRLVTILALIAAAVAVGDAVLGMVERWYSARIGEGLIYDLRTRVFAHVQRLPIAFFARTQTGSLVSRLNNDVIGAQRTFTSTLSGLVSNVISLLLVGAAMLFLSWQITVLALVILPLFLLPAKWAGRRLSGLTREQMQTNAELASTMTERFNVGGALLVKLLGRPVQEEAEFAAKSARVRDLGVDIAMTGRIFFTALTLVASIATVLVYGVGGHLALSGVASVGTLVALAALMGRLYGPITSLSNARVDVMTALVSFDRVFEVLDLEPMIKERHNPVDISAAPASVRFDHVSFSYPRADEVSVASLELITRQDGTTRSEVIHDVSFEVRPGEQVALVGPSGAGKTTLTHLVARLYDASAGSVLVGGVDVRDVSTESLQQMVGYVTQDAHMFHDTIGANLRYAKPDATDAEIATALAAARIDDLVDSLPEGLETVVGDRGYRLSGGERQRLAIARLLLEAPRIVVLDEATAHLDSDSEEAVRRALDTALEGRTALVVAHRLSTVRDADQILVVDAGRIVERGTHQQLLDADGLYAGLYRTQFASQEVMADPLDGLVGG